MEFTGTLETEVSFLFIKFKFTSPIKITIDDKLLGIIHSHFENKER